MQGNECAQYHIGKEHLEKLELIYDEENDKPILNNDTLKIIEYLK